MAQTSERKKKFSRRLRAAGILVVCLVVVVGVAWRVVERVLDVDRYRPRLVDAIEGATGLPASAGEIDLVLLPAPHVTVRALTLGEGDFSARIGATTVYARLLPLVKKRIAISSIHLSEVRVNTPETLDDLVEKVKAITRNISGDGGTPGIDVAVDLIEICGAVVHAGDSEDAYVVFDLELEDVLEPTSSASVRAEMPIFGPKAEADCVLIMGKDAETGAINSIEGAVEAEGLSLRRLARQTWAPEGVVRADVEVSGTGLDSLMLDLKGEVDSAPGLSGVFATQAWREDGAVTANDLRWTAPGIEASANLTVSDDGRVAAGVSSVSITEEGLAALLKLAPGDSTRLVTVDEGAFVTLRDWLFGATFDGEIRLVEGDASFAGLSLAGGSAGQSIRGIQGSVSVDENLFRYEIRGGQDLEVRGTVEADFGGGQFAFESSGEAQLTKAMLRPLGAAESVTAFAGVIDIERVSGTYRRGEGVPADLVVEGRLREGRAEIEVRGSGATFAPISARFSSSAGVIQTLFSAESDAIGRVNVDGRYNVSGKSWEGAVTVETPLVAGFFAPEAAEHPAVRAVLDAFGTSNFATVVALPTGDSPRVAVAVERIGEPGLHANIAFEREADGLRLGAVDASAAIPLDGLGATVSPELATAGTARIEVERGAGSATFVARCDLRDSVIGVGEYVRKAAGDEASVEVVGDAAPSGWTPRRLRGVCLGEDVSVQIEGERFVAERFEVDLGRLSSLLPEGSGASGSVSGSFSTAPFEVRLMLDAAGFTFAPGLSIDSATGEVAYADGYWTLRDLTLIGANSDCTVTAGLKNGAWQGQLRGEKFDVNTMLAVAETAGAVRGAGARARPDTPETGGVTGTFAVAVDAVYYKRARFEEVRADVELDEEAVRVRALSLRPYSGSITGTADIMRRTRPAIEVALKLDDADMRFIDEVAFEEPRGLEGTLSGDVNLEMRPVEGASGFEGTSGRADFVARDGTFGRLGFATKLLSVLRTTEALQLKFPSLRDQGLIYDTCTGRLRIDKGVIHLDEFLLDSPAYAVASSGTIDVPRLITDVAIRVDVLEGVTKLIEKVPVVGGAVGKAKKIAAINLVATGSPLEPNIRPQPGKRVKGIAGGIKGAAEAAGGVIKQALPQ